MNISVPVIPPELHYSNDLVFELITHLTNTSSSNEKKALIKEYCENHPELKEFFIDTLSPYITFGLNEKTLLPYNRLQYVNEDYKYIFSSIKEVIEYCKENNTANHLTRSIVCSFIESFDNVENEQTMLQNIFLRNLRCGADVKNINSALGVRLIDTFDVQLAEPFEREVDVACYLEPKLDGVRCVALVTDNKVTLHTRNGKELEGYDSLKESILKIGARNIMYDGEIVTANNFTDTMKGLFKKGKSSKKDNVKYTIFDTMSLQEFKQRHCSKLLSERKFILAGVRTNIDSESITNIEVIEIEFVANTDECTDKMHKLIDKGYEGLMIKPVNSLYEFKRSFGWQKMKQFHTDDFIVTSIEEGTGKYEATTGAVYVDVNGVNVKVGSGFSDDERDEMFMYPDFYIGKYIEVQYQEIITDSGSLRFPTFKRYRHDK